MGWNGGFAPYVSVAERKRKAVKEVEKLKKKGQATQPVVIEGRTIAKTFWGKAWCTNLESYSDYENRLPRGRTYARNGSIIDLSLSKGEITALVSGSSIYKVKITITKVITPKWRKIVKECSGKIDSVIELLQGKFSKAVMEIITDPKKGLFPHPKEIKLSCSCPDWAEMCKHVAAVLYGVGARLDNRPEELFLLRQADHFELIAKAGTKSLVNKTMYKKEQILKDDDLSELFGISMGDDPKPKAKAKPKPKAKTKAKTIAPKRTVKIVNKKPAPALKKPEIKKSKTKPKADIKAKAKSKKN